MNNYKNKLVFLFLMMFFTSSIVIAQNNYQFKLKPIVDEIYVDESAQFQLMIISNSTYNNSFIFVVKDKRFSIATEPAQDLVAGIDVLPNSQKNTTVFLKAKENLAPGIYYVEVALQSLKDGLIYNPIAKFEILKEDPNRRYPVNISVLIEYPKIIDPQKISTLKVKINNLNTRTYKNITIKASSDFFEQYGTFDLGARESKILQYDISIPPLTRPKADKIKVVLNWQNKTITKEYQYEVGKTSKPFETTTKTEKGFLKYTNIIILKNNNNYVGSDIVKLKSPKLRMFVSSMPSYRLLEYENETFMAWDISLAPQQQTEIRVTYNYMPVFIIIVILVIIYILFMIFKEPILIRKYVKNVTTKEGAINAVKIMLAVKNRSRKAIDNVRVVDRIPNIGEYEGTEEHIKPSSVKKHTREGTLVEYHIGRLDPKEERIISYNMKAKLSILGGLTLKPAVAIYEKKGRKRKISSNGFDVRI